MLHHHLVARPKDSILRGQSVSTKAKPPAPKPKDDLPPLVQRLVRYGWSYDHIRRQVERQFPLAAPTAAARCQQRERIARLIARYRHGEPVKPVSP